MDPQAGEFVPHGERRRQNAPANISTKQSVPSDTASASSALFGIGQSIWSPFPATQSAGMPAKTNWEAFLDSRNSDWTGAPRAADVALRTGLPGLNLSGADNSNSEGSGVTHETHASIATSRSPAVEQSAFKPFNTHPLMQYPFGTPREAAEQPRVIPTRVQEALSGADISASHTQSHPVRGTQHRNKQDATETPPMIVHSSEALRQPTQGPKKAHFTSPDASSDYSTISANELAKHPELALQKAPIITQAIHPKDFKRMGRQAKMNLTEAFPGALDVLTGLNSDFYQIPYNTRLINIKTDFPQDVCYAVRTSIWATKEKVSERIMAVWEARENASEKVLFLFAVNGSKQFCGLAEMAGPWDPNGRDTGFANASEVKGTIPLVWMYVKNVKFDNFLHIKQARNGQSVANMWNGMHFDTEAGRKVLEVYLSAPHCTNILTWRTNEEQEPRRNMRYITAGPHNMNRGLQNVRSVNVSNSNQYGASGGQRRIPAPLLFNNWRESKSPLAPHVQSLSHRLGAGNDDESTPLASRFPNQDNGNGNNTQLPRLDGTASVSSGQSRGTTAILCYVDPQGNYVPYPQNPVSVTKPSDFHRSDSGQASRLRSLAGGNPASGDNVQGNLHGKLSFNDPFVDNTALARHQSEQVLHLGQQKVRHMQSAAALVPPQAPHQEDAPPAQMISAAATFPLRGRQNMALRRQTRFLGHPATGELATQNYNDTAETEPSWFQSTNSMAGFDPLVKRETEPHTPSVAPSRHSSQESESPSATGLSLSQRQVANLTSTTRIAYFRVMAEKARMKKKIDAARGRDDEAFFTCLADMAELDAKIEKMTINAGNNSASYHGVTHPGLSGAHPQSGSVTSDSSDLHFSFGSTRSTPGSFRSDSGESSHSYGSASSNHFPSDTASTVSMTPSAIRFATSGFIGRDGRPLDSISTYDNSNPLATAKGLRSQSCPYDKEIQHAYGNLEQLKTSPDSSVQGETQSPPYPPSKALSDSDSSSTDNAGYSCDSDNADSVVSSNGGVVLSS